MSAVADKLREARALIERGWCQGDYAINAERKEIDEFSEEAVCFCIAGALHRTFPNGHTYYVAKERLAQVVRKRPDRLERRSGAHSS